MLQVGYKRKEDNNSVVRLITLLPEKSAYKEEWLGNPLTEFEVELEFICQYKKLYKDHDFIQDTFYKLVDDELKVYIKNDGKKFSIEQQIVPDVTSHKYTLPNELDMEIMRNLLENYLLENEEISILSLIYDEEEREIKPFFTVSVINEDDGEVEAMCLPFKDMDALINYLKENEEDEGEDNNDE